MAVLLSLLPYFAITKYIRLNAKIVKNGIPFADPLAGIPISEIATCVPSGLIFDTKCYEIGATLTS